MARTNPAMSKSSRKAPFLKSTAVISTCLMLVFTNLLAGCVCFHPIVKQVPDTRPSKEGQKVVVHEEMPWPCKVFWGTIRALSWFFPGDLSTPEQKRAKSEQETSKWLDQFNRQYIEAGRKKPR